MQWDNLDKFRTKVDRTNLLVKWNIQKDCPHTLCYIEVGAPAGGVPTLICTPYLKGLATFTLLASSDRVSWDLPPTGLFRTADGRTYRITRIPNRHFKLGLSSDNTETVDVLTKERLQFSRGITSLGFQAMVENRYPAFAEAIEHLKASDIAEAVPISRSSYLARNEFGIISLHQNSEMVCWFFRGAVSITMPVPECLLESIIGISMKDLRMVVKDV